MTTHLSRRQFLHGAAAAGTMLALVDVLDAAEPAAADLPLVDYHVHRDNTTVEKLLEISARRGVKFGIVEHAGTRENDYPVILSSDDELKSYLASLEGKPVYRGVQAEWIDWMSCFSKDTIAQLDYVLTDAMTIHGSDGRRAKMWTPQFDPGPPQPFMDRYVAWHEEIIATEPIDILANVCFLPSGLAPQHDELWTAPRAQKVIDAAVKHNVAIEINSQYKLPRPAFLRLAKEAGAKFSFGSNFRGPDVGILDYCLEMARELGLTRSDLFTPAPPGKKPIQLRG